MNEVEERMATILAELGLPFTPQVGVDPMFYPARCNSKFPCNFKDDDNEEAPSLCDASETGCEWHQPSLWGHRYILDFAIESNGHKIAIECDGYWFHRADSSQIAGDIKRDNYLVGEGWKVLRFTASDIHTRPAKVKHTLLEAISNTYPKTERLL